MISGFTLQTINPFFPILVFTQKASPAAIIATPVIKINNESILYLFFMYKLCLKTSIVHTSLLLFSYMPVTCAKHCFKGFLLCFRAVPSRPVTWQLHELCPSDDRKRPQTTTKTTANDRTNDRKRPHKRPQTTTKTTANDRKRPQTTANDHKNDRKRPQTTTITTAITIEI